MQRVLMLGQMEPVATMPCLWMQENKPQYASNQTHMWLDRMSQTHRTSRSKAVNVLKLAHMPDVTPQQVLKAAMIGIFTPTVGQMIKCDSSQWRINRESSSALQFCSSLYSILVSRSLLFWFSISKNTVKHPTAPKPAKYFRKTKLSGELFLDL